MAQYISEPAGKSAVVSLFLNSEETQPLQEIAVNDPKFAGISLAGTIGALNSDAIPPW